MTNAEKFKEVFGFNLNTLYEEQDYDNDFEEKTFCNQITCVHCPFQFTNACVYHEPKIFWQSEYKEPKQNIFDFLTTTGIAMLDGEKIANAEWKQAIEKIKAEIEAKNTSIEDFADTHGWVNGLTNEHNAHEADLAIITKHTKELM